MVSLGAAVEHAAAPVAAAIEAGRLPGAVLGAVDAGGAREVRVDGWAQIEPERVPMARDTVFDLASLTKPIFTTSAILELVADGRIGLDQPLAELVPDLRQYDPEAPERRLTVRQCLAHRTFLPAVEPLYTLGLDPATLRAYVLQRPWPRGPAVYSDINFMLLGIVLERVTGEPLASRPIRRGLTFSPEAMRCAATERCAWRGRVLRGEVHDENAYAFGGAAGHAGLFGTADATLDFALDVLRDPQPALLERETPERTLGWEASHPGWPGGDACSSRAIGHVGFTGTGLWIDFDHGLAWTLLTNRVHPTRHRPSATKELRPQVGQRLLSALA
jgi:CubicO group peptidase (beta-lactamase class C family)